MNSSISVGAFEAKTKLSELLERVQKGESFVITKRENPVASLSGYAEDQSTRRLQAVTKLRELRERYTLGGLDARMLREDGRA